MPNDTQLQRARNTLIQLEHELDQLEAHVRDCRQIEEIATAVKTDGIKKARKRFGKRKVDHVLTGLCELHCKRCVWSAFVRSVAEAGPVISRPEGVG